MKPGQELNEFLNGGLGLGDADGGFLVFVQELIDEMYQVGIKSYHRAGKAYGKCYISGCYDCTKQYSPRFSLSRSVLSAAAVSKKLFPFRFKPISVFFYSIVIQGRRKWEKSVVYHPRIFSIIYNVLESQTEYQSDLDLMPF